MFFEIASLRSTESMNSDQFDFGLSLIQQVYNKNIFHMIQSLIFTKDKWPFHLASRSTRK